MGDYLLPVVTSWDEWRPIFTDAGIWRPVIEQLWAAEPALRERTGLAAPGRVAAGFPGTSAVFRVDDRAVIKFFPPMVAGDAAREVAVYRLLDGRMPGSSLLAAGTFHDRIDWPYLVITFVPGQAWREVGSGIVPAQQEATMEGLGRVVRLAHETPLRVGAWPMPSTWGEFVSHRLLGLVDRLQETMAFSASVFKEIDALLGATDWFAARPRLLHGDLTADHLLVAERDGRWNMTGLIDWADALVGDPYYEWVALWFDLCRREERLFSAFQRGYDPNGKQTWLSTTRMLAFTFLHRFVSGIVGEVISRSAQRKVTSLVELGRMLYPGLASTEEK